jgi:hypothetical protein
MKRERTWNEGARDRQRVARYAFALFTALAALAFAPITRADPDDYVLLPGVEYGEREIELRLGTAKNSEEPRASAGSVTFGYGATPWWFTEISVKFNREGGESTRYDAFEWENKFQLSKPGQYFVDVGFVVEIEVPRERAEGYELRIGPLLQKDFGPVQVNFNPLLEHHFHSDEHEVTEFGYQWQVKYRWRPEFEFGAQGFGEVGEWNHWARANEQEHILGPAIFGKFSLGGREVLKYNAAVLFKASSAAPDHTFRAQLEYEF